MPQLDVFTYFSQFFWFSFIFLFLYFRVVIFYLPKLAGNLKLRANVHSELTKIISVLEFVTHYDVQEAQEFVVSCYTWVESEIFCFETLLDWCFYFSELCCLQSAQKFLNLYTVCQERHFTALFALKVNISLFIRAYADADFVSFWDFTVWSATISD